MYANKLAQQARSIFVASLAVMQYWLLAAQYSWSCVRCAIYFVVEPRTKSDSFLYTVADGGDVRMQKQFD